MAEPALICSANGYLPECDPFDVSTGDAEEQIFRDDMRSLDPQMANDSGVAIHDQFTTNSRSPGILTQQKRTVHSDPGVCGVVSHQ
jgi:hypothetical protein